VMITDGTFSVRGMLVSVQCSLDQKCRNHRPIISQSRILAASSRWQPKHAHDRLLGAANELRIRVARHRDTILGWTKSGARRLLLEFQRAWTCGAEARREQVRALEVRAKVGGLPRVTPRSIGMRRAHARPVDKAEAPQRRGGRAGRRRTTPSWCTHPLRSEDAHANQGFPFDSVDSASATDRRRPVAVGRAGRRLGGSRRRDGLECSA